MKQRDKMNNTLLQAVLQYRKVAFIILTLLIYTNVTLGITAYANENTNNPVRIYIISIKYFH
jgi:hypothetical protein